MAQELAQEPQLEPVQEAQLEPVQEAQLEPESQLEPEQAWARERVPELELELEAV